MVKNRGDMMRRKNWFNQLDRDDLAIADGDIQDLEDDELSLAEAAFYEGYMASEMDDSEDYY